MLKTLLFQALAVMRKLAITHPKDRQVLAAYGKALAGAGQFEAALDAVRRAQTPETPDWKLLSAEGAILDQLVDGGECEVGVDGAGAVSDQQRHVGDLPSLARLAHDPAAGAQGLPHQVVMVLQELVEMEHHPLLLDLQ